MGAAAQHNTGEKQWRSVLSLPAHRRKWSLPLPAKILTCPTISTDTWLVRNADALASVRRGLEQASYSQGRYLGSFAEFADLDIDDDED